MKNGTQIHYSDTQKCPVHNGSVIQEYMQGRSFLNAYDGCNCVTKMHGASYGYSANYVTYHTSFADAKAARRPR